MMQIKFIISRTANVLVEKINELVKLYENSKQLVISEEIKLILINSRESMYSFSIHFPPILKESLVGLQTGMRAQKSLQMLSPRKLFTEKQDSKTLLS